jgi:hypothetical protein
LYLDITDFKHYQLRSFLLNKLNLQYLTISPWEKRSLIFKNYLTDLIAKNKNTLFIKELNTYHTFDLNYKKIYLDGYWQNPKYFEIYRKDLLTQIVPVKKLSKNAQKLLSDIENINSISIHIRRGDYASNPKAKNHHGILPVSYYKKSVENIKSRLNKQIYFIFTDDASWTKTQFTFLNKPIFISDFLNNEIEELYLMSRCKHNIIANSTFSWWGAWLNQNKNKLIIAPKSWFKNTKKNNSQVLSKIGIEI